MEKEMENEINNRSREDRIQQINEVILNRTHKEIIKK